MTNLKEEELNSMLMVVDMREILDLEENKEKVYFIGKMELFMKDNLKEVLCKDMVFIDYLTDKFIKDNLEEIKDMALENILQMLEHIMVVIFIFRWL
jgi:hypothetical protein